MLPMMCSQPPCMNIPVSSVIQPWPDMISAGVTDHCSPQSSPYISSRVKTYTLAAISRIVTIGHRCVRRDASPSGIMPPMSLSLMPQIEFLQCAVTLITCMPGAGNAFPKNDLNARNAQYASYEVCHVRGKTMKHVEVVSTAFLVFALLGASTTLANAQGDKDHGGGGKPQQQEHQAQPQPQQRQAQ